MSITRRNTKVLCRVLLLRLGNVGAAVLAVVHPARCLPPWVLRKLSNSLDGIADGQEVDEADGLLADDLDGINGAELAQVFAELVLRGLFRQVA